LILVTDNRRGVEHLDLLSGDAERRKNLHQMWSEATDSSAEIQLIHYAIQAAITMDPLEWFTGKLALVLDGIEASSRL